MRASLANVFVVVFIDLLGFGLILPLLPYYSVEYGATPLVVGLLVAAYALAQLIGAPLLGRLSDRYGRRPVLLLSIAGTVVGLVILALAEPIGTRIAGAVDGQWAGVGTPIVVDQLELQSAVILLLMFFSRVLDGLTGGNISVAQAYIADITDESNRAKGLGLIGAAFGLGFILGPALGGFLSQWGYAVPALAAAGLATANLIGVYLYLPESLTPERRAELARSAKRARLSLKSLVEAVRRPVVGSIITIRFVYGLAFALMTTVFSLWALQRLGLGAQATGYVLAYVGLLAALVQGIGVGWLTARFREDHLVLVSLGMVSAGLLGWGLTSNVPALLGVMAPLAVGGGVLNTLLNSVLTKSVEAEEVGGMLGISASVESLTRVLAPVTGGWLLGAVNPSAPGLLGAVLTAALVPFAWRTLVRSGRFAAVGGAKTPRADTVT